MHRARIIQHITSYQINAGYYLSELQIYEPLTSLVNFLQIQHI